MAKMRNRRNIGPSQKDCAKKKMLMGLVLIAAGLIKSMGYDWEVVLMVVGVLVFLKGLLMKFYK